MKSMRLSSEIDVADDSLHAVIIIGCSRQQDK